MVLLAALWYATVSLLAVPAVGVLRRFGFGDGAATAAARVVGLAGAGYLGWLAGYAGVSRWWWVAVAASLVALPWAVPGLRRMSARRVLGVEVIGLTAFALLAFLRLPDLAIRGTEKPMDLAILATLLRPGGFPPNDPWLAGEPLAYYSWGFVPWVAPARLLGLAPDVVYNLLVPTLAAVTAQLAWALARALGGSRRAGCVAAFLVVFAGTPDGWRQLLSGRAVDLWVSSRGIAGAITEFPLFTFSLGDLHPHLLAVPLLLAALLLARAVGHGRHALAGGAALLTGAAAVANPWCAVPVGVAVALVVLAGTAGVIVSPGRDARPWAAAAGIGVLAIVLFLPHWLAFASPVAGVGWVTTPTRWDELALFLGAMVVPALLVSFESARRWGGWSPSRRALAGAIWLAAVAATAAATARVALAVGLGAAVALALTVVRRGGRAAPHAFSLALVPMALLAAIEIVHVRDPYGPEFYRMNTVFKATHLAFTLLAVLAPVLLEWLARARPVLARVTLAAVCLAGIPQLGLLAGRAFGTPLPGWGGLAGLPAGEAEAVAFLRALPPGSVLVEAVGEAYTDAARLSSASGVPAVLGWANHELVWRGASVVPELERRRAAVERLYGSGNPGEVRSVARSVGATHVAIGAQESRRYPPDALAAVRGAGRTVFSVPGCEIVEIDAPG